MNVIERIDGLIEAGSKVLATYTPPSRRAGFTMGDELDRPKLLAWRAKVQNFLTNLLGVPIANGQ